MSLEKKGMHNETMKCWHLHENEYYCKHTYVFLNAEYNVQTHNQ